MAPRHSPRTFAHDKLDLKILQLLLEDARIPQSRLARKVGVDKRTVAKRLERMQASGVLGYSAEVDWTKLGVDMSAYVGSTTGLGDADVSKLYDFIRREPRIVEAYSTVGSNEYFFKVLDRDLQTLREEVLRKLEPLTADLSTSIISSNIKPKDFAPFLAFLLAREGEKVDAEGRRV